MSDIKIGINAIFLVAGEGGGIERYIRNLIKALQRIDQKNAYTVFTNQNNVGTFGLNNNFKEHFCPVSARFRPMKILWEQLILPFQAKRAAVDVLLCPGNMAPVFLHCPSVVVIYDLVPFAWPSHFTKTELYPLKALLALSAKRASSIITISGSSKKQIERRFNLPGQKITVLAPACDETFLEARPTLEDMKHLRHKLGIHQDFILYTASTKAYKNMDRLLLAFSSLKKKYGVQHRLVITGLAGQHHQALLDITASLGLVGDVVFTGYVPDSILPTLYAAASVFVYPSLYEGFGLPVLEAMALGTPVVASNTTSLPEVVGDAGLLVNPLNPSEMADAIYRVITQASLRRTCIAKGRKRVAAFSWEDNAMGTLAMMRSVARRHH